MLSNYQNGQNENKMVDVRGIMTKVRPLMVSAGFVHDCVVGTEGVGQCAGDDEEGQSSLPKIRGEGDDIRDDIRDYTEAGMDTY